MLSKETFFALVQLGNFVRPGRPNYLAYRSRAAAVLAYCAGLWFPEVIALRRRHWMPKGEPCILVEGTAQRSARRIPASPATIWAVQRFLAQLPPLGDEEPMFECADGLPLKQEITNALRRLGAEAHGKLRSRDLRASFEAAILAAHPGNEFAHYLVGAAPPSDLARVNDHPPLKDLDLLLRRSGHLYEDCRELWRSRNGRTPSPVEAEINR